MNYIRCQLSFEDRPGLTCWTEVMPKTLKFGTYRFKNSVFEIWGSFYLFNCQWISVVKTIHFDTRQSILDLTPKNLWFAEIDNNAKKDKFIHSVARFSDKKAHLVDFWI